MSELDLGELEFKTKDFEECTANIFGIAAVANRANALLRERLAKLERVFWSEGPHNKSMMSHEQMDSDTHYGYLIGNIQLPRDSADAIIRDLIESKLNYGDAAKLQERARALIEKGTP